MIEGRTVNDDEREEFAARMRMARAYVGATQDEVADRLGVSRQTVSTWERGRVAVPVIARRAVVDGLIDLGADPGLLEAN